MKLKSTTIAAGEFKARCLALLDEVASRRHTVIVTKRGRAVAQVVPLPDSKSSTLKGSLIHDEDPFVPVDVLWKSNT